MENVDVQVQPQNPIFEFKKTIEQTPFQEGPAQSFLKKWCEINDSIVPQIARRQYWEQHVEKQGLMSENPDGTMTLFIPKDLHLWEIVGVIEAIDRNTFDKKPEVWKEKKEKIQELGKIFRNSGIYLAQRINSVEKGKFIAEALAKEFFTYGNALITGFLNDGGKEIPINQISLNPLSPEETEQVDRWLAGESLYRSRMERVKKEIDTHPKEADRIVENGRKETLGQFFRTTEKAFVLNETNPSSSSTKPKPWSTAIPIHTSFLQKLEKQINKEVETPKLEVYSAIFRRGLEKLINEITEPHVKDRFKIFSLIIQIKDSFPSNRKLTDAIDLQGIKDQLQAAREKGEVKQISEMEMEIVKKIQKVVSMFPYRDSANNPSKMVSTPNAEMNCLGRTIVAGTLLKELGIKYLQVGVPDHAIIFLITSAQRVFWEDLQMPWLSEELHDNNIQGKTKDGKKLTVVDIISFSNHPKDEGLSFNLNPEDIKKRMRWAKNKKPIIEVFPPDSGQRLQLLGNTIDTLMKKGFDEDAIEAFNLAKKINPNFFTSNICPALERLGYHDEAIEIYKKAISVDPDNSSLYYNLALLFRNLGKYQDSINVYQQGILIDPKNSELYNGMGNTLYLLDQNNEAFKNYQHAIELDPKSAHPYNGVANILTDMGKHKEAIATYRKFISRANPTEDKVLIERAKQQILVLEKKVR